LRGALEAPSASPAQQALRLRAVLTALESGDLRETWSRLGPNERAEVRATLDTIGHRTPGDGAAWPSPGRVAEVRAKLDAIAMTARGPEARLEQARTFLSRLGLDPAAIPHPILLELGEALESTDDPRGIPIANGACMELGHGFQLNAKHTEQEGSGGISVQMKGPNFELTIEPTRDGSGASSVSVRLLTSSGETFEGRVGMSTMAPDDSSMHQAWAALEELGAGSDEDTWRSFARGALLGDFGGDDSWAALAGQTAIGFVPVVGQLADLRDLAAAMRATARGEPGAGVQLGAAILGVVPGLDFLKAARVADRKVLRAASEELGEVAESGLKHAAKKLSKEAVAQAKAQLKQLAVGRAELLARVEALAATPGLGQQTAALLRDTLGALTDHLTPDDLVGALRDALEIPVKKASTGEVFQHKKEVEDAIASLENLARRLRTEARHCIEKGQDPSTFSKLADALEEFGMRVDSFLVVEP
jgi:hypothetical protein